MHRFNLCVKLFCGNRFWELGRHVLTLRFFISLVLEENVLSYLLFFGRGINCGFSREPINWVRNASSITSPGISLSVKNHHKGLFELWACFTKVWLPSSSISSGWCQTSSQGFEILRRPVFPAPAPFRSIELFRLGRWALCHTAESFNKPTCVGNILDRIIQQCKN